MAEPPDTMRHLGPALLACAAAAGAAAGTVHADSLTIDRLFDAPALSGPAILAVKIAPDGSRVTYLKAKPDHKDRLDLWVYDVGRRQAHLLVDADTLAPPGRGPAPSEEELARRERQRTAALSGILEYAIAPSGRAILFPLNGRLFYVDLESAAGMATPLMPSEGPVTDATVSPKGGYVGYVRDQNLFVYELAHGREIRLTGDGGGAIKNGMAEFVAQEEMGRSTGYWWSPDETHIAYVRVDETPVPVVQRFEIAADDVTTFAQRYPAAGAANALVRLAVVDVHSGGTTWIDLGADTDIYLARVNWLPDGRTLAIQRESRDQRRLDLLFADIATGAVRTVLTETSDSWIELNDDLTFLRQSREFLWASSRDGFEHLYLYDDTGRLIRRLTAGAWNVNDFHGRAIKEVDESRRLVYFTANAGNPTERNLYVTSLDTERPDQVRRITRDAGLHSVQMHPRAGFFVDTFSSHRQPPRVGLFARGGGLIAYLSENRLDDAHPDAPYRAGNAIEEFGSLPAADGQALWYRMWKPHDFDPAKRYPAIVDVYGGPGVQSVLDNWSGGSFTQILTRAGYVVFQLDNRGSGFRGTAFQSPIHGRTGEIEVADQVRGARWLAEQGFIDPARIGVWGWSYGGYMALMLLFRAPELFRAGVSGAPVTDWTLYDTHYTERYLGRPQDNPAGFEASSVFPYAKDLRGRLLLIHGMADDNVLFANSTKLMRRLQDLGKPFDVMVYPGAKHGLLRQHDGRHAYAAILRFFDANLRPVAPDTGPAAAAGPTPGPGLTPATAR